MPRTFQKFPICALISLAVSFCCRQCWASPLNHHGQYRKRSGIWLQLTWAWIPAISLVDVCPHGSELTCWASEFTHWTVIRVVINRISVKVRENACKALTTLWYTVDPQGRKLPWPLSDSGKKWDLWETEVEVQGQHFEFKMLTFRRVEGGRGTSEGNNRVVEEKKVADWRKRKMVNQ